MVWVREAAGVRGTRYTGVYRDLAGGKRSAGTFSTRKKAHEAAVRAEGNLAAGKLGDLRRGRQTLQHFVESEWLPNHVMEAKTRENYTYLLNRYVLPELGKRRMAEILPATIRDWVKRMETVHEANPPTIVAAKVVIDAIFTTALNDRVTSLHPGKGVRTPPVARKPKKIITSEQFDKVYSALGDPVMQLLVEVDIESGLRWGELTELRVKDFNQGTGIVTVARAVVQLQSKDVPLDARFVVKNYPKDREWREVQLPKQVAEKVCRHIREQRLGPDDLIFALPVQQESRRLRRPAELPDPESLGLTEPNEKGRQYRHGTATAYATAKCRCQHCKDAVAAYRASRRAAGKDSPRTPRTISSDGHIPANWFRRNVWNPALKAAEIGVHITPHGMRHAHASWLLAGGADLQVVKERLGHGSITTTEKYLHTLPGAHDVALAALDAVRGRTGNSLDGQETSQGIADLGEKESELARLRAMVEQFRNLLGDGPNASLVAGRNRVVHGSPAGPRIDRHQT